MSPACLWATGSSLDQKAEQEVRRRLRIEVLSVRRDPRLLQESEVEEVGGPVHSW